MEAQKPLEQETPETTPQEVPTATIPQPESTPAANMEADPIPEEMDASPESPTKKTAGKLAALTGGGIVADSVPHNEYMESANKARAVINALESASEVDG